MLCLNLQLQLGKCEQVPSDQTTRFTMNIYDAYFLQGFCKSLRTSFFQNMLVGDVTNFLPTNKK